MLQRIRLGGFQTVAAPGKICGEGPLPRACRAYLFFDGGLARSEDEEEFIQIGRGDAHIDRSASTGGFDPTATPLPNHLVMVAKIVMGTTTLHYGELDTEIPGIGQVDGEILQCDDISYKLHPDRKIPRSFVRLTLRNTDQSKNTYFRSATTTASSFLHATVTFQICSMLGNVLPVGMKYVIDRVEEITPTHVTLQLVDSINNVFGYVRQLPTYREIVEGIRAVVGYEEFPMPSGNDADRAITINLGRAMMHGVPCVHDNYKYTFDRTTYTLGREVSDQVVWWIVNVGNRPAVPGSLVGDTRYAALNTYAFDEGAGRLRFVLAMTVEEVEVLVDGERWFVALAKDAPNKWAPSKLTNGMDNPYRDDLFVTTVDDHDIYTPFAIDLIENRDRVYWQSTEPVPYDSPSLTRPGVWDPLAYFEYILSDFLDHDGGFTVDTATDDQESTFREVGRELHCEWPTIGNFAGHIKPGDSGAEIASGIASSFGFDFYWEQDSKGRPYLRARHPGLTYEDMRPEVQDDNGNVVNRGGRVARARKYDAAHDIASGSFSETVPLGNERWGLANTYRLTGLKEYSPVSNTGVVVDYTRRSAHGRVLEKSIDVSWKDTSFPIDEKGRSSVYRPFEASNYVSDAEMRTTAKVELPLSGAVERIGNYVKLTHYAGSQDSDGYSDRVFRIEGWTLKWSSRTVALDLLDVDDEAGGRPYILDDEDLSLKVDHSEASATYSLDITAGDAYISTPLFNPNSEGIVVGDILRIEAPNGVAANCRDFLVIEVDGVGVDFKVSPAPVSTDLVQAWTLYRGYDDPVSNEERPGHYLGMDNANDLYGALCDEDLTDINGNAGTMSNGSPLDPGYEL